LIVEIVVRHDHRSIELREVDGVADLLGMQIARGDSRDAKPNLLCNSRNGLDIGPTAEDDQRAQRPDSLDQQEPSINGCAPGYRLVAIPLKFANELRRMFGIEGLDVQIDRPAAAETE